MPSASSHKQIARPHCVISTLPHSKAPGNMQHDDPNFQRDHHQQPENLAPLDVQVATMLWPQQTINYWFPNWRELFHGFTVVQQGQPRQTVVSSFEQTQAVTCTQHIRSNPSPCSSTQCLQSATDDPTHRSASLAQQQIGFMLTSTGARSPHSHLDDASRLHHYTAAVPRTATQSPTPKGDAHVSFPPSSQAATGPLTKYTIKSPFWLPQGWVTEIQLRRTGTTADKFYKHLVSGRRFRSRNEVLHFINTGKGRTRTRDRHKKSLSLVRAASLSIMNSFAHKKHAAFAASKLFPPSSSENRHPTHGGKPLLAEPRAGLRPNGETGHPSNQYSCFTASSSVGEPESSQLQPKRPAQERTQKLPVKKKAKTVPPNTGEDKQTSKLWQWFKRSGAENKASDMAEQRNDKSLCLKDTTSSQKTAQLGRDIQAAHRTVVQMSKEMQATAEKLSREIREAQKDVELGSDPKQPGVPAEMDKTDASRMCRDGEAAPRPCTMMSSLVQAPHWLPIAAGNQGNQPDSAVVYVSQVIQKPNRTKSFSKQGNSRLDVSPQATNFALNALTQERSFAVDCMNHGAQPTIWPDNASRQGNQSTNMACELHEAKRHVDTSCHPTQVVEAAIVTTVNGTQAAQLHVVAPFRVGKATIGDAARPSVWPGAQPPQIAIVEEDANPKTAERSGFEDGHSPQPSQVIHVELRTRTQAPQRHEVIRSHHCIERADIAQAPQRQLDAVSHLLPATERPGSPIGHTNAPLVADSAGHAVPNHAGGGGPSNLSYAARVNASCGAGIGMYEEIGTQKYQDRKARRLRRKKFAAVLNPKLDLSRLNPTLTARQRAKVVQRMKTQHARELLATLGLHLCRKAIRRKPWLPCMGKPSFSAP